MSLKAGSRLGPYRILSPLGAGGMGEVFRAEDTKLHREVALKVLPEAFARDAERMARFEREAQVLAALNHPNIAAIYGLEESDGVRALVMELAEGSMLSERIARGAFPFDEALAVARQIAEALECAHERGIVHRDLKPDNVKIRDDGAVKVLDFGLAKALGSGAAGAPGSGAGLSMSSTITAMGTQPGVILGTAPYMSPEQAKGRPVDKRADIWAFGCVLYEMLAGRRAFGGDTVTDVLAAIARAEPDWKALPEGTPPAIRRLLVRALEKDPKRRLRDIGEARIAIDDAAVTESSSPATPKSSSVRAWVLVAALVVAGLGVWATFTWLLRPQSSSPRQLTADSGLTIFPALSLDGKLVAYASDRATQKNLDIWVQPLTEGGQPIRITTNDADDFDPDFSPDGGLIAFESSRDGGGIYVVPVLGGEERLLARGGRRPRFSPDGKSIAYCASCRFLMPSKIFSVPVTGGAPVPLATDVPWASVPVFSSDGRYVLFEGAPTDSDLANHDWWVAPVQGGPSVKTGVFTLLTSQGLTHEPDGWKPDWLGDRVRFIDRRRVWEIKLSPGDWRASGPARQLTSNTGSAVATRSAGIRMVFDDRQNFSHLWKLKLDWNQGKALGEPEVVTHSGGSQVAPSSSGDGAWLAYSQQEPSRSSIRVRSLAGGREITLVSVGGRTKISPDGSQVAYTVAQKSFYLIPAAGGEAELLMHTTGNGSMYAWTPDGMRIVYWTGQPISWFLLDPKTRQSTPLISHPRYSIHNVELSPDQRWLAFRIPMGRRNPAWIAALREGKPTEERDWIPLSDDADITSWSPDGNLLYMLRQADGNLCLWAQRLDPSTKRTMGEPFPVHHIHTARINIVNHQAFGPAILPDGMIYGAREQTGNVWLVEE
jgi:serine/threonine protein kinase